MNARLHARTLRENESQRVAVRKELSAILANIDAELKTAHDMGKNCVQVTLPIVFAIPYMDNAVAQRTVYYGVIKDLESRGFTVKCRFTARNSTMYVSWYNDDELQEMQAQMHYIAARSL